MDKNEAISALKTYFQRKADVFNIDMAFLYGSWASGLPKEESDVDIAMVFTEVMEDEEIFEIITTISLELTDILKKEANVLFIDRELSKPMICYNAIILVTSCLFISFLYLWYEVNNNVENRENAIERVWKIYTRGIMYSIISGIIVLDLICETFYHNLNNGNIEGYNNIYVGIFGVIDPKVLLVFFPLALLIGIFVQIIWEEKPITEPL